MDLSGSTCSPESAAGTTRCASPGGPPAGKCGQGVVPVSHSAQPGSNEGNQTPGTSGQRCGGSLESASLQRSLESRLRANLGANGSMEYSMTWKQWAIGSREPICALRASGHRTSDKDYTGWQTPTVEDSARAGSADDYMKYVNHGQTSGCRLRSQAQIAGWPTPNCADVNASRSSTPQAYSKRWMERENHGSQLAHTAQALVRWPTASARDFKDSPGMATEGVNPDGSVRKRLDQLARVAQLAGTGLTSFPATMENRGALNPAHSPSSQGSLNPQHSRWLMGFPWEWCLAAIIVSRAMKNAKQARKHAK
jgi:hypothetical protein